jgi:hypothetical protein
MKHFTRAALFVGTVSSFLGFAAQAKGALVIRIEASNPSAVTFTATALSSSTNSNLRRALDGITVENFFTAAVNYSPSSSTGNLIDALGIVSQGGFSGFGTFEYSNNDGAFGPGNDLSIYRDGGDGIFDQIFTSGSVAFAGSETYDFSSTPGALPVIGTTGNVISGYFQSGVADHGEVIGQWEIVPEPSSSALFGLGIMGLMLRRARA